MRQSITLFINGERHDIGDDKAFMMLADYLRYERELCGTKIVCAEGDCGACTVLCARTPDEQFVPINSCIAMLAILDGCHLVTVEGLAQNGTLTPVQKAIVTKHGSQCGYCTPGFVMAMTGIFEKPCASLSEQKIKNCLTGNLCRCTGYQPLIEAALSVDARMMTPLAKHFVDDNKRRVLSDALSLPLQVIHNDLEFFAPTKLIDAINYRAKNPRARIIAGASDLGVQLNKSRINVGKYLSLQQISSLHSILDENDRIIVGACANLTDLRTAIKTSIPAFADFLNIFASPQIKNVATLVGNVVNGSPIADTIPFLMIVDGLAHVTSTRGERTIAVDKLYLGYKQLALSDDEIVTHLSFSKPRAHEIIRLSKVSQRKDLDIATVNCALRISMQDNVAHEIKIAVGGVAASVVRLGNTEAALVGKSLTRETIDSAITKIATDISPMSDLRGSANYRSKLVDKIIRHHLSQVAANAS